jgi:hypothetical protein
LQNPNKYQLAMVILIHTTHATTTAMGAMEQATHIYPAVAMASSWMISLWVRSLTMASR